MATKGNSQLIQPARERFLGGSKVLVVKTAWNSHITNELAEGCRRVLEAAGVEMVERVVPGAVELTFAIQHYINHHGGEQAPQAAIALGCVIRGDTPHFEYVCQSVTQGITMLNTSLGCPVIFGVLTVNTEAQALERVGGIHGHKGEEAALTALEMIDFVRMG